VVPQSLLFAFYFLFSAGRNGDAAEPAAEKVGCTPYRSGALMRDGRPGCKPNLIIKRKARSVQHFFNNFYQLGYQQVVLNQAHLRHFAVPLNWEKHFPIYGINSSQLPNGPIASG
jgi:hypothetical protein